MAHHNTVGEAGEQLASQWLAAKGFTILHRNWRAGRDEIDIVARDGDMLVVVEVKTRSSARWGAPEWAVGPAKRRSLMRAAAELVHAVPGDPELRFDVVSITHTPAGPEFLHIPDAFYPTL
ncbi:MAG: YraN family protein [Flavobacteriales bacterium]|nr:YraN family protein [Flavobacteriales bacterium]MCL4281931.1 YraN family protein [Flavobacteriales bacterium]